MKDLAEKIIKSAFKDKTDKAGRPYIYHLYRVANKFSAEDSYHIVALLHDLLEDCPEWNEKVLRVLFSDSIVDSVVVITKHPQEEYHHYITRVLKDGYAAVVKKKDLEDNMDITRLDEITDKDVERLRKYLKAWKRIHEEYPL